MHPTNSSCVNSQRISANGNWIALVQIGISIFSFLLCINSITQGKLKLFSWSAMSAIRFHAVKNLKTNVKKYVLPWTDDSVASSAKNTAATLTTTMMAMDKSDTYKCRYNFRFQLDKGQRLWVHHLVEIHHFYCHFRFSFFYSSLSTYVRLKEQAEKNMHVPTPKDNKLVQSTDVTWLQRSRCAIKVCKTHQHSRAHTISIIWNLLYFYAHLIWYWR